MKFPQVEDLNSSVNAINNQEEAVYYARFLDDALLLPSLPT
ncbi:hypothetical protein O9929_12790 [Vibrio lentus]|nr:hypothetical protein [Vibrio lentus]